jgi:hypothetical protein
MTRAIGSFAKESATRFDRRHSFTEREGPLGNNPEEIVAIGPQTVIHTTPDVPTPQSAAYSREANQVFVGSDAGKLNIYDGTPGIGIDERWLRISALCLEDRGLILGDVERDDSSVVRWTIIWEKVPQQFLGFLISHPSRLSRLSSRI